MGNTHGSNDASEATTVLKEAFAKKLGNESQRDFVTATMSDFLGFCAEDQLADHGFNGKVELGADGEPSLSEKYTRRHVVEGFWENIVAGLGHESSQEKLAPKRLLEELSGNLNMKSTFSETLEKRIGLLQDALDHLRHRTLTPAASKRPIYEHNFGVGCSAPKDDCWLYFPFFSDPAPPASEKRESWVNEVHVLVSNTSVAKVIFASSKRIESVDELTDTLSCADTKLFERLNDLAEEGKCDAIVRHFQHILVEDIASEEKVKEIKAFPAQFVGDHIASMARSWGTCEAYLPGSTLPKWHEIVEHRKEARGYYYINEQSRIKGVQAKAGETPDYARICISTRAMSRLCARLSGLVAEEPRALVALAQVARATGNMMPVFELVNCFLNFHRQGFTVKQIDPKGETVHCVEEIEKAAASLSSTPTGSFINGPLPSLLHLPPITNAVEDGSFRAGLLYWVGCGEIVDRDDNSLKEESFSITLTFERNDTQDEHRDWVTYTFVWRSACSAVGEVIRTSSLHVEHAVCEDIPCIRSVNHPLVVAFEITDKEIKVVIDGKSNGGGPGNIKLNFSGSPHPGIAVSHATHSGKKMAFLGCHYCFLGDKDICDYTTTLGQSEPYRATLKHVRSRSDRSALKLRAFPDSSRYFVQISRSARQDPKSAGSDGAIYSLKKSKPNEYSIMRGDKGYGKGVHFWEISVCGDITDLILHVGVAVQGISNATLISVSEEDGPGEGGTVKDRLLSKIKDHWESIESGAVMFSNRNGLLIGKQKDTKTDGEAESKNGVAEEDSGSVPSSEPVAQGDVAADERETSVADSDLTEKKAAVESKEPLKSNDRVFVCLDIENGFVYFFVNGSRARKAKLPGVEGANYCPSVGFQANRNSVRLVLRKSPNIGVLPDPSKFLATRLNFSGTDDHFSALLGESTVASPTDMIDSFDCTGDKDGFRWRNTIVSHCEALQKNLGERAKEFWNQKGLGVLHSAIQNGAKLDVCQWVYDEQYKHMDDETKRNAPALLELNKSLLHDAKMYHWSHLYNWLEYQCPSDPSDLFKKRVRYTEEPWFRESQMEVTFRISKDSLWFPQGIVKKASIDAADYLEDIRYSALEQLTGRTDDWSMRSVQLRIRHDLWRYELSCDLYDHTIKYIPAYRLLAAKRPMSSVNVYVRFGHGLRRPVPTIEAGESSVGKSIPGSSSASFEDLSVRLLSSLANSAPDMVTRPLFSQYSGECLCTNVSQSVFTTQVKVFNALLERFMSPSNNPTESDSMLVLNSLQLLVSNTRYLKSKGSKEHEGGQIVQASAILAAMNSYNDDDNTIVHIHSVNQTDRRDILEYVPGAAQALHAYWKNPKNCNVSKGWRALLHVLSGEKFQSQSLPSPPMVTPEFLPKEKAYVSDLKRKLEYLIENEAISEDVQCAAGNFLGEALVYFYPSCHERLDMLLNLLRPFEAKETLTRGQETLFLATLAALMGPKYRSIYEMDKNIIHAAGCKLLLPVPKITVKKILESNGKREESDVANYTSTESKSEEECYIYSCQRQFMDLSGKSLRVSKASRAFMTNFLDLIKILMDLSGEDISQILSKKANNTFLSYISILNDEAGRSFRIPESLLNRITVVNGVSTEGMTAEERLSQIKTADRPLHCQILEQRQENVESEALTHKFFQQCVPGDIGFSSWIDAQDNSGKWWVSQIVDESTDADGNKSFRVQFTSKKSKPKVPEGTDNSKADDLPVQESSEGSSTKIIWSFENEGTWVEYDEQNTALLEENFRLGNDGFNILDSDRYCDFFTMSEVDDESGRMRSIKRNETEKSGADAVAPAGKEWIKLGSRKMAPCGTMCGVCPLVEKLGIPKHQYDHLLGGIQAQLLNFASNFLHHSSTVCDAPVHLLLRFCRLVLDESFCILGIAQSEKLKNSKVFSLLPSMYTSFLAFKRTPWLAESMLAPSARLLQCIDKLLRKNDAIQNAEISYRDAERVNKLSSKHMAQHRFKPGISHSKFKILNNGERLVLSENTVATNNKDWSTAALVTPKGPMKRGTHSIAFKIDQTAGGDLFFGVCTPQFQVSTNTYLGSDSMGNTASNPMSWGWFGSSRPCLYPPGRVRYGARLHKDDIVKMTLDLENGTLSYSVNGTDYGVAFGPGAELLGGGAQALSGPLLFAVSMIPIQTAQVTVIHCVEESTQKVSLPSLLDLEKTVAAVCGCLSACLISGPPVSRDEEHARRWLESPLFASGIDYKIEGHESNSSDLGMWGDIYARECGGGLKAGGLMRQLSASPLKTEVPPAPEAIDPMVQFLDNLATPESLATVAIFKQLEEHSLRSASAIEKRIRQTLPSISSVDNVFFAALVKHSTLDTWKEAKLLSGGIDCSPSGTMLKIWDKLIQMRKWLRGVRGAFDSIVSSPKSNAKSSQERFQMASASNRHEPVNGEDEEKTGEEDGDALPATNQAMYKPWEQKSRLRGVQIVAGTFEEFCEQVSERAMFLLALKQNEPKISNPRRRGKSYAVCEKPSEINSASLEPLLSHYRPAEPYQNEEKNRFETSLASSCFEYIQDGFNAPPVLLRELLALRRVRATQRIFGLQAMLEVYKSASYLSAKDDILVWLRPALRGISAVEWDLENFNNFYRWSTLDETSLSHFRSLRAAALAHSSPGGSEHHYFKDLGGCEVSLRSGTQNAACELYLETIPALNAVYQAGYGGNCGLARTITWTWCINFNEEDASLLQSSNIIKCISNFFSYDTLKVCSRRSFFQDSLLQVDYTSNEIVGGTEQERLNNMIFEAERSLEIEKELRRIASDNSNLYLAQTQGLDQKIRDDRNTGMLTFDTFKPPEGFMGSSELINPSFSLFQYLATVFQSEQTFADSRKFGVECTELLENLITEGLQHLDLTNATLYKDVENFVFKNLSAALLLVQTKMALTEPASKLKFLRTIMNCLTCPSPRIKNLAVALIAAIIPHYEVADVDEVSKSALGNHFFEYLVCSIGGSVFMLDEKKRESSAELGSGYGSGQFASAHASNLVAMCRTLLNLENSGWPKKIVGFYETFLASADKDKCLFAGLFSILGGNVECLRVGAKARLKGGTVGTIVQYDPGSSMVGLTFGESASMNPQSVAVASVIVCDPISISMAPFQGLCERILSFLHQFVLDPSKTLPDTGHIVVAKRIIYKCICCLTSNAGTGLLASKIGQFHKAHLSTTLQLCDLPRFMDLPSLEYTATTLRHRFFECNVEPLEKKLNHFASRWIDLGAMAGKTDGGLGSENNEVLAVRKNMAMMLMEFGGVALGWTLELCIHALKENNDDQQAATNWLDSPLRYAYERSKIGANDGDDTERWYKARRLAAEYGLSPLLCWYALRMHGDQNTQQVMQWCFEPEGGQRYMAQMVKDEEKMQKRKQRKENEVPDKAIVDMCTGMGFLEEDVLLALAQPGVSSGEAALNWLFDASEEQKDAARQLLLSEQENAEESAQGDSPPLAKRELDDKSALEEIGHTEDILRSSTDINAGDAGHSSDSSTAAQSRRSAPAELMCKDIGVFENGILVAELDRVGAVEQATIPVGTVVSNDGNLVGVASRCLNGLPHVRLVKAKLLRNITELFGRQLTSVRDLLEYACSLESALSVQYARRSLLAKMYFSQNFECDCATLIDFAKVIAASEDGFSAQSPLSTDLPSPMEIIALVFRKRLQNTDPNVSRQFADALVNDCTRNVFETTQMGDSEEYQEFESLHPYFGHCDYTETVEYKGAKALRICFDGQCETSSDSCVLSFSTENGNNRVRTFYGSAENWRSFVIHSDTFQFRFQSRIGAESRHSGFGYKFTVSPLLGLQWNKESQVREDPSLEWACWVLDFLATDDGVKGLDVQRAVHSAAVFEALTRYLRSPGAPFKTRVIKILIQLLKNPALFSEKPDLTGLIGIKNAVMARCDEEKKSQPTRVLLSHGLQQLVELAVVARAAAISFEGEKSSFFTTNVPDTDQETLIKNAGEGWTPGSVELAIVYAVKLMDKLDAFCYAYDMNVLNAEGINLDNASNVGEKESFALLMLFNKCLGMIMEFLDISPKATGIGSRLNTYRGYILLDVKTKLMTAALGQTRSRRNAGIRIRLDRYEATRARECGLVKPHNSKSCFVQAFKQMYGTVEPHLLRGNDRLFEVGWSGGLREGGIDAGGPYRDALNVVATDCCSEHFDLFVRSQNGVHERGLNRDKFVPNPQYNSPMHIQMYEFVGLWMGISFRTKANLPFMFSSIVWKPLVGQQLIKDDLYDVDVETSSMIERIRKVNSDEDFNATFSGMYFVVNETKTPLLVGGENRLVSYENRLEYCKLIETYHLNRYSQQTKAICRGFSTIVPERLMALYTWEEAEMLTCGSPIIDLEDLKKHTTYGGFTQDDVAIKLFWEVLESFTNDQRSRFIDFAWGRSRLPRPGTWNKSLGLTRLGTDPNTLPIAHTCFFNVELPPYETFEQASKMLTIAVEFGTGAMMLA
jgi:hypothetical protein